MPRPHFPTKSIYARSIHQTFPALKTRKRKGRRSAALENNQIQISTPGWADGITHLGFQLFKPNPAKIHNPNPNPNPHPISLSLAYSSPAALPRLCMIRIQTRPSAFGSGSLRIRELCQRQCRPSRRSPLPLPLLVADRSIPRILRYWLFLSVKCTEHCFWFCLSSLF